jgi:hypothetical protein
MSVIFLGVLFVLCGKFNLLTPHWLNDFIFYLTLPALSILLIFRRNPIYFGFQPGDYKVWGFHLLIACPLIAILIYLNSTMAVVPGYHGFVVLNINFAMKTAVALLALEYIYRGFFIFGLKDTMQEGAIMVQLMPYVLIHGGRSEAEIVVAVLFGLYLGYLSYRGNSFWPAFILHYFVILTNRLCVNYS